MDLVDFGGSGQETGSFVYLWHRADRWTVLTGFDLCSALFSRIKDAYVPPFVRP